MRGAGVLLVLIVLGLLLIPLSMWAYPQYRLYSQRLAGEARLAEAQSSRRIAILEAEARRESAETNPRVAHATAQGHLRR
ncbi:MAG: hypothetical protein HRT64_07360 [Erythrobacter sp.]|nr:hypothetical protein [Erythrobacter sp.]